MFSKRLTTFAIFAAGAVVSPQVSAAPIDAAFGEGPIDDNYLVQLKDSVFFGHTVTDMDSVGSSIGAAHLFGGKAARASEINSETAFVLAKFGVPAPEPVDTFPADKKVTLVDFNQNSQLVQDLQNGISGRLVGIIDHHAIQSGIITTDAPIYIDIRPWGSACTIIAHTYFRTNTEVPREIAGLLLSGILSDTLNLRSPTTTDQDRTLAPKLAAIAGVLDTDAYAQELFAAKSAPLNGMTALEIIQSDAKTFPYGDKSVFFAVVETTDPAAMMARKAELAQALAQQKQADGVNYAFFAIVDIVNQHSNLLILGDDEARLAACAWGSGPVADSVMDLGGRVSRKKDFMPEISRCIASGF